MPTVESQRYSPNKELGAVAGPTDVGYRITQLSDFHNLPQLALEMGFWGENDLPTRAGNKWMIYTRPQHKVPNFADGPTVVNSRLAIYENDKGLTQAVLKTSEVPYRPDDEQLFRRDLEVFTRHYIERPWIWGFPARVTTNLRGVFPAMAAGILVGGAIGYGVTERVNEGAIMGMIVGPVPYGVLWWLSERYARDRISGHYQYRVGTNAKLTLLSERRHVVGVAVQQELYDQLRQVEPALSPEQFLDKIYGQLPPVLLQRRFTEVEGTTYSSIKPPSTETESTLPHLLGVARFLQAAV